MTDRVREAVFDILGSYYGKLGVLPPLRVADAFAGSGSLGLEAVSRGAAECWFFETGGEALKTLRENARSLGGGAALHIQKLDVWSRGISPAPPGGFDLVFLDPPYANLRQDERGSLLRRVLERGNRHDTWHSGAVCVLHHETRLHIPDDSADGWEVFDRRTYGSTGITFLRRSDGSNGDPSPRKLAQPSDATASTQATPSQPGGSWERP